MPRSFRLAFGKNAAYPIQSCCLSRKAGHVVPWLWPNHIKIRLGVFEVVAELVGICQPH